MTEKKKKAASNNEKRGNGVTCHCFSFSSLCVSEHPIDTSERKSCDFANASRAGQSIFVLFLSTLDANFKKDCVFVFR